MEFDYIIATVIFVGVFVTVVVLVSGQVTSQKDFVSTGIAKEDAYFLMKRIETNGDELSLESPVNRLYIFATNKNSGDASQLVQADLSKFGKNDPNSVFITDDENKTYQYVSSGSTVAFSSTIPFSSTKLFYLYFDDDSNFSTRGSVVSGNNTASEIIYGPEVVNVVQYRLLEKLKNRNYSDSDNFQVIIEKNDGEKLLEYGTVPDVHENIIVRRKPVIVQLFNASLVSGWLTVRLFE